MTLIHSWYQLKYQSVFKPSENIWKTQTIMMHSKCCCTVINWFSFLIWQLTTFCILIVSFDIPWSKHLFDCMLECLSPKCSSSRRHIEPFFRSNGVFFFFFELLFRLRPDDSMRTIEEIFRYIVQQNRRFTSNSPPWDPRNHNNFFVDFALQKRNLNAIAMFSRITELRPFLKRKLYTYLDPFHIEELLSRNLHHDIDSFIFGKISDDDIQKVSSIVLQRKIHPSRFFTFCFQTFELINNYF